MEGGGEGLSPRPPPLGCTKPLWWGKAGGTKPGSAAALRRFPALPEPTNGPFESRGRAGRKALFKGGEGNWASLTCSVGGEGAAGDGKVPAL